MCNYYDKTWIDIVVTAIVALIAALIGGGATLLATRWSHNLDIDKAKIEKKDEIKALLQAIKVEVDTLFDLYMEGVGNVLDSISPGEPFSNYFYATQDYFSVYSSNAEKIGSIEDNNLRMAIVKTYSHARSLIDTYNMNNNLIQYYDNNLWLYNCTSNQVFLDISEHAEQNLIEYASALKTRHNTFKDSVDELKNLLNENISL